MNRFHIEEDDIPHRNGGEKFRLSLDTRVTTCKGKAFLQKYGIKSIEDTVTVEKQKTNNKATKQQQLKASGSTNSNSNGNSDIPSMFRQHKLSSMS